ncbi:rhodanese-like domain-containing protein [Blastopirellula sp. J2-11]|uniref:rhodanese-like domain-containing protein n=1 Tax=Blastopirellula sp. J2-11 TaxID=2943192 RepID=UPI0021CA22C4|nr:rhodanese-like domain-containing protein [Blastopirellula sp. J2-11]UUO05672.1 rhodanese-like domain-containing protein [Blastopirellula sp. J2-11]
MTARTNMTLIAMMLISVSASIARGEDLKQVLEKFKQGKAVLLDVREEVEWKKGHLAGATLAPFSKIAFDPECRKIIAALPPGKEVYTYGDTNRLAFFAANYLEQRNGQPATALRVRYSALVAAGFKEADLRPKGFLQQLKEQEEKELGKK